jgi:tetratricopeptide (TPR) repeat protein
MRRIVFSFLILMQAEFLAASMVSHSQFLENAQTLFEHEKYEDVIENLPNQRIESLPSDDQPQAYLLLGESYLRQGEVDKALGVFQLAAQLFPKNINVLSQLADLLHGEELDDQAKVLYERVLDIHPNNSDAHLRLAEIAHSQGFLERSIEHYERCLVDYSQSPEVLRAYATVLSERRDYAKAAEAMKKSISLDPDNAQSLEALAQFQYRQGMRTQAEATMREAIAKAKGEDKSPFLLEHALWLLEQNKLEASLSDTERVLQKSPNNPLGRWIRASVLLRQGNHAQAMEDLRVAASANVRYPFISSIAQNMIDQLEHRK